MVRREGRVSGPSEGAGGVCGGVPGCGVQAFGDRLVEG